MMTARRKQRAANNLPARHSGSRENIDSRILPSSAPGIPFIAGCLTGLLGIGLACTLVRADWPQFRGPGARSVAVDAALPTAWDDGRNIAWRIDLPGRGPSSPIVVGQRVLLTATSGFGHRRLHVLCYQTATGRKLWERRFWATGRTATHSSISGAAPTPASDGQRVYAFFSSNDLICLTLDGDLVWYRGLGFDYPKAGNDVGMASSPVVIDGAVIVQVESQSDAFAAGIDAATGQTLWHVERTRLANWSSPIALPVEGRRRAAVLLAGRDGLKAHDPRTGELVWDWAGSLPGTPSPVLADGVVFAPMNGLTALRLSNESNAPEVLWNSFRMRPGAPSPVVWNDRVFALAGAVLKCADARTGQLLWQLRLKGQHWATPVIAGSYLYAINYDGEARAVKVDGAQGEIVGESRFGQRIHASPAVADNAMYVRSDRNLWKIAMPQRKEAAGMP